VDKSFANNQDTSMMQTDRFKQQPKFVIKTDN